MLTRLLIANRGEIACRIARTARRMGIATVAVHSDPDRRSPHVEACDEAVAIGGAGPAESYLRIDAIVDAARATGADAVHPGYGFLAENAELAEAVAAAGMTWVGPSPESIREMGDKIRAKERMAAAGVPVLPSVAVADDTDLDAAGEQVGFPLLVKASAGGGGKGMRVVHDPAALADEVAAARRESAGAFGDDRVFLERFVQRPRHIEVQILGDGRRVVHLGERECSIQRRHQKIIEESPSPVIDAARRAELGEAGVAAGEALGYTGAGTVEMIMDDDTGDFYFLEVNTRLQVEHPVTEMAWRVGDEPLDLVRWQLRIAAGAELDFDAGDLEQVAHAVEARVYAEDPAAGFLPATGRLAAWRPAGLPGVRWDDGVVEGGEVSVHYDPMLAKVIAAAPTRHEAALLLARELEASQIAGVTTNREFLVACLRHEAFLDGRTTTTFIDEHMDGGAGAAPPPARARRLHLVAAALADARARHLARPSQRAVPMGFRTNRSQDDWVTFEVGGDEVTVTYRPERDGRFTVAVDGEQAVCEVHGWPDQRADGRIDLALDGVRGRCAVVADGDRRHVASALGSHDLREVPRFPDATAQRLAGGLTAPMHGSVISVEVSPGDRVADGDLLLTLEAMKMEHRITAPVDGEVAEVRVAAGDGVEADEVLVVVSADGDGDDGDADGDAEGDAEG